MIPEVKFNIRAIGTGFVKIGTNINNLIYLFHKRYFYKRIVSHSYFLLNALTNFVTIKRSFFLISNLMQPLIPSKAQCIGKPDRH
jgi:hypothetical protein